MNVLLETYVFYADIYFIQNFLIKIFVLYLSLLRMKQNRVISHMKGLLKLIETAFFGTLVEVIGLLCIKPYWLFLLMVYLVIMPFLMRMLLPQKEKSLFVFVAIYVFYTLIVNGVIECLWNYFDESGGYIGFVLVSGAFVLIGVKIWNGYHQSQKGIYQIKMIHKGKEILTQGYYDSGNCLKDPYSHKGVQIISKELIEQLVTEEEAQVYIPYQSLGNENGMIIVVYIDYLFVFAEKEKKLEKVPVGIADDNLFKDKLYKVILNEGVL